MIGVKIKGHNRYRKSFYGLTDMPVIVQEEIERILKLETTV